MASTIEMAASGYKQGAREQEIRRTPAKPTLSKVMGVLHYHFAELLVSPPTKQEARFLSKDMQTLLRDLELADKGMQVMPKIEQNIGQIQNKMYQAIADMKPDLYNELELSFKNEQKMLDDIRMKVKDTIRAANIYNENNAGDIAKSRDMLKVLRTELSAPYKYSDAKDNLPTHTKTVVQWLDDLKDKGSLDDRMVAKKILESGGIDAVSLLKEVERQGLSLTDRAVAEMRDGEAGKSSPESQNIGHESPGQ